MTLNATAHPSQRPRRQSGADGGAGGRGDRGGDAGGGVVLPAGARARALSALPEQRYAYYLAVPLGLLVAFAAARECSARRACWRGLALLALAALGNAGLGAYHAGVEWKFWPGPTECTGPVGNLGSAGNLLERLDKVKVVRCDEVQWTFLGLSLAGYNVLISLLMAAIAAWGFVAAKRA